MEKKSVKVKKMIIILVFALVVILIMIISSFIKKANSPDDNIINNEVDGNSNNTTLNENSTNNTNSINTSNEQVTYKLNRVIDMKTYFKMKSILDKYYDSNNLEKPTELIDSDAIEQLKMNDENYEQFNNFDLPIFRIDEIYKQEIDEDNNIYVIYHEIGTDAKNKEQTVIWARVNEKEKCFSIYPYKYLEMRNCTNLKNDDIINLDGFSEVKKNEENTYKETSNNTEKCTKDLFERYKFDLLVDNEHLYDTLNDEYRNSKYPQFTELEKYINDNKADLRLDQVSEYSTAEYGNYVKYSITCKSKRILVFKVKNMMKYMLELDNYTIAEEAEKYNSILPAAQARYCLDNIVQAINYGDYNFVYEKLNPVQKNNYYQNIEDFKEFIRKSFYEVNNYEVNEDYLIISDNVYQFNLKLTDATGNDFSYKKLKMTITLNDNEGFYVSIVKK